MTPQERTEALRRLAEMGLVKVGYDEHGEAVYSMTEEGRSGGKEVSRFHHQLKSIRRALRAKPRTHDFEGAVRLVALLESTRFKLVGHSAEDVLADAMGWPIERATEAFAEAARLGMVEWVEPEPPEEASESGHAPRHICGGAQS